MSDVLSADILARELPDRVSLYIGGAAYQGEADRIVRELATVLEHYELRLRTSERREEDGGAVFTGRLMTAKFPGHCAVCGSTITMGSPIIYDSAIRKAAHSKCGGARS